MQPSGYVRQLRSLVKLLTKDKDLAFRASQIRELLTTQTARNSGFIFAGNLASTFISVFATMLVSRSLGPSNFGKLAIFTSVYTIILGLTDFGLGTTSVKIISSRLEKSPRKAGITMKVVIWAELIAGLLVATVGFLFAPLIARMLGSEDLLSIVRMAFVAGAFASAGAFIGPFLSAFQQFAKSAIFGVVNSAIKTLGVFVLFYLAILNLDNVVILYTVVNIFAFFVGFILIPKNYLVSSKKGENKEAASEIFHFSKWILLSYVASVISSRLDIFLLQRYHGSEAVGLYAAAQQLAMLLPLFIGAITTALLPRISKMKSRDEFSGYLKRVMFGSITMALLATPLLLLAPLVVRIIFGVQYVDTALYLQILAFGYLFALIANPVSLVFYARDKPKVLTALNYFNLVIITALFFLIIPKFGALGAALCFAFNNFLAMALIIPLAINEIKKIKK